MISHEVHPVAELHDPLRGRDLDVEHPARRVGDEICEVGIDGRRLGRVRGSEVEPVVVPGQEGEHERGVGGHTRADGGSRHAVGHDPPEGHRGARDEGKARRKHGRQERWRAMPEESRWNTHAGIDLVSEAGRPLSSTVASGA